MHKWHAQLEYFQFPLKVLFLATLLLGVGNAIVNSNLSFLWDIDNKFLILISEIMRYSGGFIIRIFPLFIFFKVLTRKFEDTVPVFIGFLSLIIMQLMVLTLESTRQFTHEFPSYFYNSFLGIQIQFPASITEGVNAIFKEGLCLPFDMGILTLIIAFFITKYCYLKSRHYSMHGLASFIDHDSWSMLLTIFYSIVAGIALFYIWPIVISVIQYIFHYISSDILNPINMFLYGIMERFSALLGLQELPRNAFWLNSLGGTATDNFGVLYNGDINTWYAMQNLNIVTTNAGHLITPYYVINIFLVPSFLLSYLCLVTDKKDRRRYYLFFIIAISASILFGNPLPFEIFIAILSPMLYIFYLFIVGILFAIFQILGVAIGYYFEGPVMIANPGSLLDLVQFFYNPNMYYSLSSLAFVGGVVFIVFFILTRVYFKVFALGFFNMNLQRQVTKRVVDALGGLDNIVNITSTPDKMTVSLDNRDIVDFEKLRKEGAYLILESKNGYLIRLVNLSTIIAKNIKMLKRKRAFGKDL